MLQNTGSNDKIDRQLTGLNQRVERLEETQVTGFDRISEEIDALGDRVDMLESEFNEFRNDMNEKLDTILKHITGIS